MKKTKKHAVFPEQVLNTFSEMERNSKDRMKLSLVGGRYYVYVCRSVRDRLNGRRRQVDFYVGSIDAKGNYKPARHRKFGEVKSIEQYIIRKSDAAPKRTLLRNPTPDTIRTLRQLSMDSRTEVDVLATMMGITRQAMYVRLKRLTDQYAIRKTIEIYPERFGFYRYVMTLKFLRGRPDHGKLREFFEKEPRVQFAALMMGAFDMFIYAVVESAMEMNRFADRLLQDKMFSNCDCECNIGPSLEGYGFMPLRVDFFDLLKDRVWHRTKEAPRKPQDQLTESEYAVMRELTEDAGRTFASIDNAHKFNPGLARHTYTRLIDRERIERATIVIGNTHADQTALFYAKVINTSKFYRNWRNFRLDIIRETNRPVDNYSLFSETSAPYGNLYISPIYDSVEKAMDELDKASGGSEISAAVFTEILIGRVGFRKFDASESDIGKTLARPDSNTGKISSVKTS